MTLILRTQRQTLRHLLPDDAAEMFALNADPDVVRYTPDRTPASVEEERRSLEKYQEVYRTDGFARWAAIDNATGEWLGWCGLRRQPDGEVDVGYRYHRRAWGRGLATEAARACVDYGFGPLLLRRIIATAYAENVASLRVLEKIGLVLEKRETVDGVAKIVFALSRDEWLARNGAAPA